MPWTLLQQDGVTPIPAGPLELGVLRPDDVQPLILKNTGSTTLVSVKMFVRAPDAGTPGEAASLPVRNLTINGRAVPTGSEADAIEVLDTPLAPGESVLGTQHVTVPDLSRLGMVKLTLVSINQEV